MSESSTLVTTIDTANPELMRKADVLDGVFMEHFDDPRFRDIVTYYDLALPLAHMISHSIITQEPEPTGVLMIEEAYNALLERFGVSDKRYFRVDEILADANEAKAVMIHPPSEEDLKDDEVL